MKKAYAAFTTILVIVMVMLAVALVGVRLIGLQPYSVLSGSMDPTYKTGDLVYVRSITADQVEEGDVITFKIDDSGTMATHRVVKVTETNGNRSFTTKGDANNVADSRLVTERELVGKVVFSIPRMGSFLGKVQTKNGRIIAIAVGIVLVALVALPDFFKKDKEEKAQENKEKEEPNNPM